MKIYMFGSCRIEQPLTFLQNKNIVSGVTRESLANVYNTKQIIQHIDKEHKVKNIEKIKKNKSMLSFFFPLNNLKYETSSLENERSKIFNKDIELYIIEISSLKNIMYENLALGTSIEADIKYYFGIDFSYIKNTKPPRKLNYNIENIILLSKTAKLISKNFNKINKNNIKNNIKKKYTDNLDYFKDKVNNHFFEFFTNFSDIIKNCEYCFHTKDSFFQDLDKINSILKKPILFIPHWNAKDKNGNLLETRIKLNDWLKEYCNKNNHHFLNHENILNNYNYDTLFNKYSETQFFEKDRYGIYDINHLSEKGVNLFSKSLEKYIHNIKS